MKNKQILQKKFRQVCFWKQIFTILFLSSITFTVVAQEKNLNVSGVITDKTGEPLIGVTIMLEDAKRGTTTDLDGKYSLEDVPSNARLLINSIGFAPERISVNNKTVIDVVMVEDLKQLEDVVVIGYGSANRRDITGAISSVSSEKMESQSPVNIMDAVQGQVAGVEIVSGSGAPGEGSNVRVRGTATFEGGAKPLYVVDGVIYDNIDDLNPDDIASMEVLKDAASAAIYGSRSANGVFLITTKQGEKGSEETKTSIKVKYLRSYSTLTRKMSKANAFERKYYDLKRRELSNNAYGYDITDSLAFFQNQDNDLQELLFQTAIKDEVNLTASGATDVFKYYLSTGLLDENGIIVNSGYSRLTSRVNAEYIPNKKLTVGTKTSFSISNRDGISESTVLRQAIERIPHWAIFQPDGSYTPNILNRQNPYAVAMTDINKRQQYKLTFYEYLTYKLTDKLVFNTNVQGDFDTYRSQNFRPQPQLNSTEVTTGEDYSKIKYGWTNENYLSYKNTFNKNHNVEGMIGGSFFWERFEYIQLVGLNYSTDEIYTLNAASGFDAAESYSSIIDHRIASLFGRASYNFKGKYLFNANLRYDGSSRFGRANRWGAFPSGSAAWRFSDEKFLRILKPLVYDAKIRVSYGITGNEQIADYSGILLYSPDYIYDGIAGIAASNLAYDDLSWEETSQFNTGLDLSLNKGKIRVVFDYYNKLTDRLLNQVELPKETGFASMYKNVGAMSNEGLEFSLGLDLINKKKLKWDVDFNIATNEARITTIADGIPFYRGDNDAIYIQEGSRLGEFYGYKYQGIFAYDESNAFTDNWEALTPVFDENGSFQQYTLNGEVYSGTVNQKKASNGDILKGGNVDFYDKNKDGYINVLDKELIGCAQPDFFGGISSNLTYDRFTLSVSLYYSVGGDIYNWADEKRNTFKENGKTPSPEAIANMWTKQGDQALYAAPIVNEHNMLAPSDFYFEDASYVKLKNVKFEYKLPRKIARKVFLQSASVNIYGKNLLTFTNYKGYDPEFANANDPLSIGIDTFRYPRKREYGFGIDLRF